VGKGGVDEVDHARPTASSASRWPAIVYGRDDAAGAGLHQPGLRIGRVGAGDDEELGVERAGRQDDVDVVGVRVDRRDQALGPLDAGGAQGRLFGRVAFDLEESLAPGAAQRLGQDVDDHDLAAGVDEFAATVRPTRP
jgi:hypothetical protein